MITITNNAADEIKLSAHNPDTQDLILRFAVEKTEDGWQYMMGFDELKSGSDTHLESNSIEYIVAYEQRELLDGTTVDFDESKYHLKSLFPASVFLKQDVWILLISNHFDSLSILAGNIHFVELQETKTDNNLNPLYTLHTFEY